MFAALFFNFFGHFMHFIALPYDENSTSFETTPDFGRKAITQKVGLGWQREGLATKMLSWMKILSTQQTHHEPLTRAPECAFDFNSNAMCSFYVPASIEYGFKDSVSKMWIGSGQCPFILITLGQQFWILMRGLFLYRFIWVLRFFLVSVNFVLSFKMVRYIEKMGSLGGQLIKHTIH